MSKNFEEEYKALAQQEAPDLWNRIEAGLTPGSAAPAAVNKETSEKKNKIRFFLTGYKTIAAAAVCAAVIIPTVIVLSMSGGLSQKSESSIPMDMAMLEEAAETTEAAADGMAESEAAGESEAAAETTEAAGESEAAAETTEAAGESEAAAEATEAAGKTEAAAETAEAAEDSLIEERNSLMTDNAEEKQLAEKQQEEQLVIRVRVLSVQSLPADEGGGSVYEVSILEDSPGGIFEKGDQISLHAPLHASTVLEEGESCPIVIAVDDQELYPYLFVRIYEE